MNNIANILIDNIKLLILLVVNLELFIEMVRGDKHKILSHIALALSVSAVLAAGYCSDLWEGLMLSGLLYALYRWGWFSPAWGVGKGKGPQYLGDTSVIDRFEKRFNQDKLLVWRALSLTTFVIL